MGQGICSQEHGSIERDDEGKMQAVRLCTSNPETKRLRNLIASAITLIKCKTHEEVKALTKGEGL
jgi:ribosomal protein S17E